MVSFNIDHLYLCLKTHRQEETSFHPRTQTSNQVNGESQNNWSCIQTEASDWIQKLQGPAGPVQERISFAAIHSKNTAISSKSVCQLLPWLPDSVNTTATVGHHALVIKTLKSN